MRALGLIVLIGGGLLGTASYAAAPAGAPAGTTGLCNDGTYYSGATTRGACRGHKGLKAWYGTPAAGAATTSAAPSAAKPAVPAPSAKTAPAAGGGYGKVWVNTGTKVYHCPGNRWYGKTKKGEYMSEAQAKAQGYKPDHGKPCK